MELYPYQKQAIEDLRKSFAKGAQRVVLCLPTGAGKSIVFTEMVRLAYEKGTKTLVLTDRTELFKQAVGYISSVSIPVEEIHPDRKQVYKEGLVFVGMVETLKRRRKQFVDLNPGLIIADECHAGNFTPIFELFPDAKVIGATATPVGAHLFEYYQDIVQTVDVPELVSEGFLVPCKPYQMVDSFDDLTTRRGEFTFDSLSAHYNKPTLYLGVIEQWKKYAEGKKTIVFCVNIEHTINTHNAFIEAGIKSAYITSKTSKEERERILLAYHNGMFDVLNNCGILCLDGETEILTDHGWVNMEDMSYNHKVANWDNGSIYFEKPKFIIKRERMSNEKMVTVKNSRVKLRVTEHHEVLWSTQHFAGKNKWNKNYASDVVGKKSLRLPCTGEAQPFTFDDVIHPKLTGKERKIRISINSHNLRKNNGFSFDESKIEAEKRLQLRESLQYKNVKDLSLDECKFIGFFIADGTRVNVNKGGESVQFSQSKVYPHIIEWFDTILQKICIDFKKYEKINKWNGAVVWTIGRGTGFGSQKVEGFFPYEMFLQKKDFKWMWGLSKEQFEAFVYGFWAGDGEHKDFIKDIYPKKYRVANTNIDLFDTIQAVGVCRGFQVSITPLRVNTKETNKKIRTMTISKRKVYTLGSNTLQFEEDFCEEKVWCVTTTSGNIITRRKGNVIVTGNTKGYNEPSIECVIMNRATQSIALWLQCCGRGSRTYPGKKNFILLDFGGNHERLGLWNEPRTWKLKKKKETTGEAPCKVCPECLTPTFTTAKQCPECKFIFPIKEKEEKKGVMVEVQPHTPKELIGKRVGDLTINELIKLQKAKKFKPTYVWRVIRSKGEQALYEYAEKIGYSHGWAYTQKNKLSDSNFTNYVLS